MNKTLFNNIVVSGEIGSGTTTLAQRLARKLGWKFLSVGSLFRQYHLDQGIPLWNKLAVPLEFERKTDKTILEKLKKDKNLVIEGHYQGYLASDLVNVYKILLICDQKISLQRVLKRDHTHKETEDKVQERSIQIELQFKKLYGGGDFRNKKLFNLVINTSEKNIQETVEIAFKAFLVVSERLKERY